MLEFDHTIRKANGISQLAFLSNYKNQKFESAGYTLVKASENLFELAGFLSYRGSSYPGKND